MRQGFDISVNDYNREVFSTFKTVLEQREDESSVHILLKVLAASIFFEPGILVEPEGVDQQYRPDVLLKRPDGVPRLWIECGQVRTVKLDKLTSRYPDTDFIVVKRTQRETHDLFERSLKEIRRPYRLGYLSFDAHFADRAAQAVHGKNDCIAIISGQELQFIINGNQYDSTLFRLQHDPPAYRGKRTQG